MRDKLRNKVHFENKITVFYQSIDEINNWILTGKTPYDRVNTMKRTIVQDYLTIIKCKYSAGYNPEEIKEDLINAIQYTFESWDGFWKLRDSKGKELNQYTLSAYDEMLWMLSLGYLLNIPNDGFQKLVDVIDRDQVKDFLFEFIIRAKIVDRQPITEESYQKYFWIPQIFDSLRKAIIETNKIKAEVLVKEFVRKWYIKHRSQGWYNSHNNPHDTYFGYWSFETAAIVKIMGLDDSRFRDCQYYPRDLV